MMLQRNGDKLYELLNIKGYEGIDTIINTKFDLITKQVYRNQMINKS